MSEVKRNGQLSRRQFASLLATGIILTPFMGIEQALAAPATLRGTVFYRERIAISPQAIVTIRLEDVSRAGAPARIIAETQTRAGRSLPISWILRFNDNEIDPRRSYALRAEIRENDRLIFVTDSYYPVFGATADETDLMLVRAAAPSGPPDREPSRPGRDDDIAGFWVIDRMEGERPRGRNLPELEIGPDGQVSGTTGCNRLSGQVRTKKREIRFTPMVSTRMACDQDSMRREQRFLFLLERASGFSIEGRGDSLVLMDKRDREMLRFRRS